jgi:hypothetical protein
MRLDFPTFERPAKATSGGPSGGSAAMFGASVTKRQGWRKRGTAAFEHPCGGAGSLVRLLSNEPRQSSKCQPSINFVKRKTDAEFIEVDACVGAFGRFLDPAPVPLPAP